MIVAHSDLFAQSDTPLHQLGAKFELPDGRRFVYGKAGVSNISVGKLQLAPAFTANHQNMAVTATAIGAFTVNVTPGATATTANQYAEGLMVVNAGPGLGNVYRVKSNPAAGSATAYDLTLYEPIRATAFTTSTKVSLIPSIYNGVVEAAVSTRKAIGVPMVAVTAAYYAWFQYHGVASVLADGALTVGAGLMASDAVAGAVEMDATFLQATDGSRFDLTEKVGRASIIAGVDTEYREVYLDIVL